MKRKVIDGELKKEKEELIRSIYNRIDSVDNENDLKDICDRIKKTNDLLDNHDGRIKDIMDSISNRLKRKTKDKIKALIKDVFDNYDKKEKDGSYRYSESERREIKILIEEINKICDRTFWDRFKKVLGIGS